MTHKRPPTNAHAPSLSVRGVSHAFHGPPILRNITFTVEAGEAAALIGPSGGGKSVLLEIIAGLIEPNVGTVEGIGNQAPSSIGVMFQGGALLDSLTTLENVAFPLVGEPLEGAYLADERYKEIEHESLELLQLVGLHDAANKYPEQLSGGMRRRLALARALVGNPPLLLLDDPTGGLDPVSAARIVEIITTFHQGHGSTVIMAGHDLRRLLPAVDSIIALFDGEVAFRGTLQELREHSSKVPEEVREFVSCRFDEIETDEKNGANETSTLGKSTHSEHTHHGRF